MLAAHIRCTPPLITLRPYNAAMMTMILSLHQMYCTQNGLDCMILITSSNNFAGAMLPLKTSNAIADSGAMQIFVMEGTLVIYKRAMS
jgi:hypothetical protein